VAIVGNGDFVLGRQLHDNDVLSCRAPFDLFIEEKGGKQIVVLNLAGGPAVPYYIRKYGRSERGCFLRIGSAAQPMTEEHIERLMNRRQPVALTGVVSRHQDLTFNQLKIFYEGKGVVLNQHFAKTLDLAMPDGKFNQLAWLFADTNRVSVRLAKWWGTNKMRLRENEEYGDCSLVKAMQKVLDKFDIENVTQARKRGMQTREELRLVDGAALRELIINAFAHNDYTNGDTPVFEIFSNRFEITSYGGLVSGMTQEEFFGGVSRPRNPEIMRIFKDLEYVERLGSGIPFVVEKYGRGIFHFSSSIIRFSLPFDRSVDQAEIENDAQDATGRRPEKGRKRARKTGRKREENGKKTGGNPEEKGQKRARKGPEKGQKRARKAGRKREKIINAILDMISDTPTISRSDMAKELSLSIKTVRLLIEKLKASGRLRRVGPDKGGHWEVIK
jgi:predicted HTH transcriptional regulator